MSKTVLTVTNLTLTRDGRDLLTIVAEGEISNSTAGGNQFLKLDPDPPQVDSSGTLQLFYKFLSVVTVGTDRPFKTVLVSTNYQLSKDQKARVTVSASFNRKAENSPSEQ
jgi:hypothetical protein